MAMCRPTAVFFLCCSSLLATSSMAQPVKYFVEKLTTTEGLGSNKINDIAQDDRGFLWIATSDGLNRFDGTQVVQFHHEPGINSLPHNYVQCLEKLHGNFLAIGTQAGLSFYDCNAGAFENFYIKQNDTIDEFNNSILHLELDGTGNLWVASKNAIYVFDRRRKLINKIFSPFSTSEIDRRRQKFVEKILPLSDGNAILFINNEWHYLAWKDHIMMRLKDHGYGKQLTFLNENCPPLIEGANETLSPVASTFKVYDKYFLYIQPCRDSLILYDENGQRLSGCHFPYNKYPYISWSQQVSVLDSAELQLSFHNYGLALIPVKWKSGKPVIGPVSTPIFEGQEYVSGLRDWQQNWWIATKEEGLQRISPQKQFFTEGIRLADPVTGDRIRYSVQCFGKYNDHLMIGTYGEGLFQINTITGTYTRHDPGKLAQNRWANFIWNVRQLSPDLLWIGTQAGLFVYRPAQQKLSRLPGMPGKPAVLDSVAVTTQFVDSRGMVWMGLGRANGVCYFDPANQRFQYFKGNTPGEYPLRYPVGIAEDTNGDLWFVNDASAVLVQWNRGSGKFRKVHLPAELRKHCGNLHTLLFQADSLIWLGSFAGGLVKFNIKSNIFKIYGHDRGLINSHINSMYLDKRKRLWLGTDGGLSCFDILKEAFINFTAKDGLPAPYPTGPLYYDHGRQRLFGGGKGVYFYFNSNNINVTQRPPKTLITAVLVNGNKYSYDGKQARFGPGENDITIQYTAIDLANGPAVKYEYKLLGEDTSWIMAGSMRQINFSHLAPGSYTFLVRASTDGTTWSNETSGMNFTIRAPLTQTGWFYAIIALGAASLLYTFRRFRLSQVKKTEEIRREISRNLHDEVGSTLTNISLGSLLAQKQLKDKGGINHLLERIYHDSQHVSESMREIVWSIDPKIDTIGEAIPRMLHYASDVLETRNIVLEVNVPPAIEKLKLTMQERRDLYLIFKEAVTNLAKYSNASRATITFELAKDALLVTISDNGKGFNAEGIHEGNGLKNMLERAKSHHWRLNITSTEGTGTTVTLTTRIA